MRRADEVVVHIDVAGREHGLLQRLLMDETLMLVDRVLVHWHLQHLVRPQNPCTLGPRKPRWLLLPLAATCNT